MMCRFASIDSPSDLLVEVDNVKFHLHKVVSQTNICCIHRLLDTCKFKLFFVCLEFFEDSDRLEPIRFVTFHTPSSQSNVICEQFYESYRSVCNKKICVEFFEDNGDGFERVRIARFL